jgi:hypothetical protein FG01414.1
MIKIKKVTANLLIATVSLSPIILSQNYVNAIENIDENVKNMSISEGVKYVRASTIEEAKANYDKASTNLQDATSKRDSASVKNSETVRRLEAARTEKADSEAAHQEAEQKAMDLFKNLVATYEAKKADASEAEKKAEEEYTKNFKELSDVKNKLAIAKTEAKEAKDALDSVIAKYPGIEEYAEKKAEYDTIKAEIDTLNAKIEKTTEEIANLESEINDLNTKIEQTTKTVEEKKAVVDEKQQKFDAAQAELNEAEAAKANAASENQQATERLATAETNLEKATKELDDAKADLEKTTEEKTQAEKDLEALGDVDKLVKDMQDEIDAAKAEVAVAEKKVEDLKAELGPLNATKEAAKTELENARAELKKRESAVAEVDKEIESKKADVKAALDAWNAEIKAAENKMNATEKTRTDAREMYDEMAAKDYNIDQIIEDILRRDSDYSHFRISLKNHDIDEEWTLQQLVDHPWFKKAIKEATKKENVYRSIKLIERCNELRRAEGLPELKVNTALMVTSVVSNAVSMFEIKHTFTARGLWNSHADGSSTPMGAENLAWGYDSDQDPFDGWYNDEKALYDQGIRDSRVGHYKNIITARYNITGFSTAPAFGMFEGSEAHQQYFSVDNATESISRGKVYTVAEFKQKVDEFFAKPTPEYLAAQTEYERIKATKPQAVLNAEAVFDDSKQKKATLVQAVEEQKNVISEKEAKVADAQKAIDNKNAEITTAKGEVANKKKVVDEKQAKLDKFLNENDVEKEKVRLRKLISELDTKLTSLRDNTPNLEKAKADATTELDAARVNKTDKAAALEAAKANVQTKLDASMKAEKALTDAKAELRDAVAADETAKTTLDAKKKLLAEKTDVKTSDENALAEANTKRDNIQLPVIPDGAYDEYKSKVIDFTAKDEAEKKLDAEVSNLQKITDESEAKLNEAKAALVKAEEMFEKSKLVDSENPDTYKDFDELVQAVSDKEEAKKRRARAVAGYEIAFENAEKAGKELKDATRAYTEAVVSYNFAKEDYERFLALKQKEHGKKSNDGVNTADESNLITYETIGGLAGVSAIAISRRRRRKKY